MTPATSVLPGLPDSFGPPAGEAAALDALARAPRDTDDEDAPGIDHDSPPQGEAAEKAASPSDAAHTPVAESSATASGKRDKKAPSAAWLARKYSRKELAVQLAAATAARQDAERRAEQATATLTATTAVDANVVDASIRDMVGDVIGLADSAGQLAVGMQYAPVVALDADERTHLTDLGARVAKIKLGGYAQQSPMIALALGVGSIALAKVIAYQLAKKDAPATVPALVKP